MAAPVLLVSAAWLRSFRGARKRPSFGIAAGICAVVHSCGQAKGRCFSLWLVEERRSFCNIKSASVRHWLVVHICAFLFVLAYVALFPRREKVLKKRRRQRRAIPPPCMVAIAVPGARPRKKPLLDAVRCHFAVQSRRRCWLRSAMKRVRINRGIGLR